MKALCKSGCILITPSAPGKKKEGGEKSESTDEQGDMEKRKEDRIQSIKESEGKGIRLHHKTEISQSTLQSIRVEVYHWVNLFCDFKHKRMNLDK